MRMLNTLMRGFAALAIFIPLAACTVTYQFTPIEATVVDAETGAPIEGAVVTANWELVKGSFDGERYFGQLEVKETVTDKNGRFYFEGFSKEDSSGAELRQSDPQILIFKAGYEFQPFVNPFERYFHDYPGGSWVKKRERTAAVNGKTVKLLSMQSPNANMLRRSTAYFGLNTRLEKLIEDCHWKNIANAIREMDREDRVLREKNIGTSLIARHHLESYEKKCGSIDVVFKVDKK